MFRSIGKLLKIIGSAIAIGVVVCVAAILEVQLRDIGRVHALDQAPSAETAIVLGASVNPDGSPSDALRDRVMTAVDLYHSGKVKMIFMTGDDGEFHVDEIDSMVRTAKEAGVPEEAIQYDGHGYRTYESCKRAFQTFNVHSALIVTQRFHLGRALFLCRSFGMDAEGIIADRQHYIRIVWFWTRDLLSSVKAFIDIYIWPPASPVAS